MEKHIQVLGILFIALGILGIVSSLVVLAIFVTSGIATGMKADEPGLSLMVGGFGVMIAVIILMTSLPGVIAGYGLTKKLPWGRSLGIIMAFINLPGVPIFTAFGIYGLWVLFNDETKRIFETSVPEPVTESAV